MQARVSRKHLDRIEVLAQAVRDIAWKGRLRMRRRHRRRDGERAGGVSPKEGSRAFFLRLGGGGMRMCR